MLRMRSFTRGKRWGRERDESGSACPSGDPHARRLRLEPEAQIVRSARRLLVVELALYSSTALLAVARSPGPPATRPSHSPTSSRQSSRPLASSHSNMIHTLQIAAEWCRGGGLSTMRGTLHRRAYSNLGRGRSRLGRKGLGHSSVASWRSIYLLPIVT